MRHAVIFDMDGVISDTERLHVEVEQEMLARYGIDPGLLEGGRYAAMSDREFFPAIFGDHGIAADIEALIAEKRRALLSYPAGAVTAIPGALELIRALRRLPLRLAVASASAPEFIEHVLGALGVREDFDAVASADEVARGKPEPDVFLLVAQRLHVPPETCVVIEDGLRGMIAARRAGMRCVALAPHGDDGQPLPADLVVRDLRGLTPHLLLGVAG
jgi:HAD superfamily hydrolase (TIGR01509 family)